jgi:hypothetical protein
MKGYKSEYYYSDEMENLRRFINLYSYARLIRCVTMNFSNEPNWLLELRKKLDNSIRKLETNMTRL